ncbi:MULTISPECIES: HK97 family phage prohead protease [Thioclava]|uniref:Prohead serine protease domain-containing protein n=2 Tax=Thioclava TaxID=285107 RepID=A0A074T885_9RHOB|nr:MULTISPECIES: HK97 family phage prohead protease [Thioclava]KEP68016.1 hypothetical protein DL1_16610 [Thioclava dalianensis]QPZ89962.1 hypothetical protein AKL02_003015 [Thioclava electrotropha]SFN61647.1 hypothetical protein SAMN05216224_10812 [Thioclava dalianensis]
MDWGGHSGGLEIRKRASGAMALHGRFPYGKRAVLSDGGKRGRPQKEVFAPKAFGYRVNDPKAEIHLLIGHSYDKPLASKGAGSLTLTDTDEALTFEAEILPEIQASTWWKDFLAQYEAGLVGGISPGFRIPPPVTVPNAEKIVAEDPSQGRAMIRTVFQALLFELSIVTQPAYQETLLELFTGDKPQDQPQDKPEGRSAVWLPEGAGLQRTLNRWRL